MKMMRQVHRTIEREAMVVVLFFSFLSQQCMEAMDGGKRIEMEEKSIYREDEI